MVGSQIAMRGVELIAGSKPPAASAAAKDASPRVGSQIESARQDLINVCDALRELLEPAGISLAFEARRLLERQSCRIAVIGQIKSGKSSFINVLAGVPGLLPTDINPSTSAVTNVFFNQASPTGHQALFRFYAEADWKSLSEGGGRLRELTQQLVPGFEPALLTHNITAMRSRAKMRLGSQIDALLGKSHAYDQISHDVLTKYVCASELSGESEIGLYSEITQSADLYLPDGPFAFPVTITDTPGTNDPMLMRDEVTRSYLDKADAFIIVLTAQQPLSDNDVALLRILRGLHKDRIIVFVNRADELADYDRDVPILREFVRRKLSFEFPGIDVPIIVGSAKWGGGMLPAPISLATGRKPVGDSGFTQLTAELNRMLANSHCAFVIRQINTCFGEMTRASEVATRKELQNLKSAKSKAQLTAERIQYELQQLHGEQQRLAETQATIERSAQQFEQQLRRILIRNVDELKTSLRQAIDAQAANERYSLVSSILAGKAPRTWDCDCGALRRALSHTFAKSFEATESQLVNVSSRVAVELRKLAAALLDTDAVPTPPSEIFDAVAPPNPSALGRNVFVDLDVSWWSQLWRTRPTTDERGEAVEQLIKSEFHPLIDELAQVYESAFNTYIDTTTRWSFTVCSNLVQLLSRRQHDLASYYRSVLNGSQGTADEATIQQQTATIARLETQLAAIEQTGALLSGLAKTLSVPPSENRYV